MGWTAEAANRLFTKMGGERLEAKKNAQKLFLYVLRFEWDALNIVSWGFLLLLHFSSLF